jgi:hypothetical protein
MRVHSFLLPLAVALSVAGCQRDTTQAAGSSGTAGTESPASTVAAGPATPAGSGGYGASSTGGTTSAMTGAPFTAEVVTVERDGSGITLREVGTTAPAKASRRMVSVDPASASSVSGLKAGDRVNVTCTETGNAGTSGMSGMSGSGTTGATGATSATGTGSLQACARVVSVMPAGR